MNVEGQTTQLPGPGQQPEHGRQAQDHQNRAGIEKQPAWAEQEQEAQVAPAIPPGAQMRRARAAVRRQGGRDLGDAQVLQRGLDNHFACELHAGRGQAQILHGPTTEAAQPTVKVAGPAAEEQPTDAGQHRVSQVAMQRRHGARLDAALEPVAHHQIVAFAQFFDEGIERAEIVAVVGVGHDDVAASRRGDAAEQSAAIALARDRDHARTQGLGNFPGAVRAAVVGNQNLAVDIPAVDKIFGLFDADADRLRLVEAGHEHGQLAGSRRRRARVPRGIGHGNHEITGPLSKY